MNHPISVALTMPSLTEGLDKAMYIKHDTTTSEMTKTMIYSGMSQEEQETGVHMVSIYMLSSESSPLTVLVEEGVILPRL